MTVSDDDIITLTSSDQKKVEITVKAAKVSELIATTLFSADENDDDDDVMMEQNDSAALEMDVPRVNGATLEKVVEFLIYFEKHPFPKMPEKLSGQTFNLNIADIWYTRYLQELEGDGKADMDLFHSVKSAANFMHINPLLEMTCLWLTFKIAALKEAEAIRELLRLPRMTQSEEEEARRKYPWIFSREDELS